MLTGCATPEYAIRPAPTPDESAAAIQIERSISAEQARDFGRQGARALGAVEVLAGFPVQEIVNRLSRVTERPQLRYRAWVYQDRGPNAAALADGRIYVSTGLLAYLQSRGSRTDELAFILAHELGHTVAQHLVKRYQYLQRQQVIMGLLAAGASAIAREASRSVQQAGQVALDAASVLADVSNSGFSQEQELEADQLGIQYVMRAGFAPRAALDLLDDFQRFDSLSPFLRTHPYMATRREYLARYVSEVGSPEQRLQQLRDAQRLYPPGSVSWNNLQRQIQQLENN
ncbi:MAG: M48 family metalloprotease [Candidatus Omnitrophica bacterium]|nr:M48 family metalloprotease [Candidatus Omnitrophota bacterium]